MSESNSHPRYVVLCGHCLTPLTPAAERGEVPCSACGAVFDLPTEAEVLECFGGTPEKRAADDVRRQAFRKELRRQYRQWTERN